MIDKCGIYKITNTINNKIYIGKSKHIYIRWRQHRTEPFNNNSDAYNTLLYKAIRKYGIENFIFEIIDECAEENLNEREKYWIDVYNTYINNPNSNGYNMTKGGEYTVSELKYDINLIEKLWNEGKSHKEIREITNYDHHILTRYLDYLNIPVEERLRREKYNSKPVYQYSLEGKYITQFSSVSEAVRSLQNEIPTISTSNICYACNNKLNSAYGYIWSYTKINPSTKKIKHTKVNQYDLNGKYITTYNTQTEAIANTNLKNVSSITQVCTGKHKTAGGYIWRYYDSSAENPIADLTNI